MSKHLNLVQLKNVREQSTLCALFFHRKCKNLIYIRIARFTLLMEKDMMSVNSVSIHRS